MKKFLVIAILFTLSINQFSADIIEITIGAGYTVIDLDSLVEKDENTGSFVTNWDQTTYNISAQYFFYTIGSLQLGAELEYSHLYWYSVKIPFVPTPISREYSVDLFSIGSVIRYNVVHNLAIDFGPTFTFGDDLELGAFFSLNYYLTMFDFAEIPIKLRIAIRNGVEIYFPITFSTGILIEI